MLSTKREQNKYIKFLRINFLCLIIKKVQRTKFGAIF